MKHVHWLILVILLALFSFGIVSQRQFSLSEQSIHKPKPKTTSMWKCDSIRTSLSRITSDNQWGVYYFEYEGEKFLTTSQGGIIQIFNTKEQIQSSE